MFEKYPEVVNTRDVTEMLGISSKSLFNNLIDTGILPYRRIGRNFKFRKIDIENYMAETAGQIQGGD